MYILTKKDIDWLVEDINEIQHGGNLDEVEWTQKKIEFALKIYREAKQTGHSDRDEVFRVIYNICYYKDIQSVCVKALDRLYRALKEDTKHLVLSTHALKGLKSLQSGEVLLQKVPPKIVAKKTTKLKPEPILRDKILALLPDNASSTADELNTLMRKKYGKRVGEQHLQNVLRDLEKDGKIYRDGDKFCIIKKLPSDVIEDKVVDITKKATLGT